MNETQLGLISVRFLWSELHLGPTGSLDGSKYLLMCVREQCHSTPEGYAETYLLASMQLFTACTYLSPKT